MERLTRLTAADLMTPDPYVVGEDARLVAALDILREHDIRQLPVVDENGRLVGIITDRDLRQAMSPHWNTEEETGRDILDAYETVGEVMVGEPVTVMPDDGFEEVLDLLLSTKVGGLPVVNLENEPVGIVTYLDVLAAVQESLE
ncbi:MAG: CBS domain-containing protein [Nitrospirae bacterium]|nr:MAG: CBS domain-containing protein [Nitrospirota bacterium]